MRGGAWWAWCASVEGRPKCVARAIDADLLADCGIELAFRTDLAGRWCPEDPKFHFERVPVCLYIPYLILTIWDILDRFEEKTIWGVCADAKIVSGGLSQRPA